MSDLNVALILRFIDQATGPARAALRNVQGAAERLDRHGQAQIAAGRAQVEMAQAQMVALRGQALATLGVGYAAYRAMQPAMQFEAQMSRVGAVARATAEEQALLTATARELGRSTPFSARQAAQGMEYLAMAGFDVNETVAAMPGMLNLASAAGADLGRTSDITSNILSGFNLQADQTGRVGDVLVNTFTSSNTTLEMLGSTMSYIAPQATAMGMGIEQAAAMAGLLGNAGIQGERAGTALRGMLTRLVAPTSEASAALQELNIQVSDQHGNLRDVPTILAEMDRAMAGMGEADRQSLMQTIWGTEAASAALYLTAQAGSGALQRYIDELHETGSAARVAAQMNDNAQGAMRRLASAAEDVMIGLGNGMLPVLADLVDRMIPIISAAGQWIDANQELVTTGAKIAGVLLAINGATLILRGAFWLLFGWVGKARIALGLLERFGANFTMGATAAALAELRRSGTRDITRLGDAVVGQTTRMDAALATLRTRALIGMAGMAWLIWNAPTDFGAQGEEQRAATARAIEGTARSTPGLGWLMSVYDRTSVALHGDAPVAPYNIEDADTRGAAYTVQTYAGRSDLPTEDYLNGLRSGAAELRTEIAALEADLAQLPAPADAYDMGTPAYQQIAQQLAARRGDLEQVEAQLASGEAEAASLTEALRILSDTEVTPEINTASIDRALDRVRSLAAATRALEAGASVGGVGQPAPVAGGRALGGPVRPGFWYRVNEQGIEGIMPLSPMRIVPTGEMRRLSSGGGRAGGGLSIGGITVNALPGMDPEAIARAVRRELEELARDARFALHDGGLGYA
jgi:TP901 family phage tail tape measure protein